MSAWLVIGTPFLFQSRDGVLLELESLGLPAAGYLAGAALAGQVAGMVAAAGVVWLTVAAREVAGLRQPSCLPSGLDRFFQEATWLWAAIFAASAAGLAAAVAVAPASAVELLATAVTVGGVAVGAFVSVLWFTRVLRRFDLHVRFAQA